jgi:hypothetical protein
VTLSAKEKLGASEIVSALGAGQIEVFDRARDARLDRVVAIKPTTEDSTETEARTTLLPQGNPPVHSRLPAASDSVFSVRFIGPFSLV